MSDTKTEYRGHVARLAKEFSESPRVVVVHYATPESEAVLLLGVLQTLDLGQEDGYAAGVVLDEQPGQQSPGLTSYRPEQLRLFSEYKAQLMNFIESGAVGDGCLICKAHRDDLCKLGFAERVPGGWNIVTAAGVAAAEKVGWLWHS